MQNFGGGVIMISHNAEFYGALCTEKWHIADGKLEVEGGAEETELKVQGESEVSFRVFVARARGAPGGRPSSLYETRLTLLFVFLHWGFCLIKVTRKKTEKEKLMEATESKVAVVGAVGNLNSVEERQTLINPKTGRPLSKKEIRAMAKQNKK